MSFPEKVAVTFPLCRQILPVKSIITLHTNPTKFLHMLGEHCYPALSQKVERKELDRLLCPVRALHLFCLEKIRYLSRLFLTFKQVTQISQTISHCFAKSISYMNLIELCAISASWSFFNSISYITSWLLAIGHNGVSILPLSAFACTVFVKTLMVCIFWVHWLLLNPLWYLCR